MDLCSLFVLIVIPATIYWFFTRRHDHWSKQNVPCVPSPIPVFGHILPVIVLKESLISFINKIYNGTEASVIGFHYMQRPAIVVRDPELIKSVLQINFASFRNNLLELDEKADPVLIKNPFFATDADQWKKARARSISHLTGKKLSYLFIIVQEVCQKMNDYLERKIKDNDGSLECELKDFLIKYTGEIVANAAFAIQGQCFEDNPDKLAFANTAKTVMEPTVMNGIKQSLLFYLPYVARLFGLSMLHKKADNYFRQNLIATIEKRNQANSTPKDYLQFCLDSDPEKEIDGVIANIIIFYADVYETSSTTLASVLYYLSQNKDVQEKLRAHIKATLKSFNNVLTFESLKSLTYLEQVLFESMRLLSPVGVIMKVCTEDIILEGSDGIKCHLQPGDPVFLPLWGLHHDSKYWTEPEVFDPDRFSAENQAIRHKFVFLPFGEGPRMCVGMRMGIMLIKLAVVSLLTDYSIEPSLKTKLPFQFDPKSFLTYMKGGLWAKFVKIHQF